MDRSSVEFQVITLSGGLRLIYRRLNWPVEHFGVIVRAGSADDFIGCEGLAHFVEHTLFKGTSRRSSSYINNRMEEIGGEINAFTTKETTVVYTAFPSGYASRAIELVGDLISDPTFPEKETLRERKIVDEEISSYLDTPSERVFDEFDDLIFANSPFGHNILGTHATLERLTSADCRRFVDTFYTPSRMVAFYSGSQPIEKVAREIERCFTLRSDTVMPSLTPVNLTPDTFAKVVCDEDNYQANVVEGAILQLKYGDATAAVSLLNNVLGGPGMNSKLNVSMRERAGLVYTVESSLAIYSSATLFTIYYGCSERDRCRCHNIVSRQINKLAEKPFSPRLLSRAKRQLIGQLTLSSASAENMIIGAARRVLYCGNFMSLSQITAGIESVTAEEIMEVARSLTKLSSLTIM